MSPSRRRAIGAVRGFAFRALVARAPPCPVAVHPPRAPSPVRLARAHSSCGLAVGRDVPIAPPRLGAVRSFAFRAFSAHTARTPWCGPVAIGRDAWPPPPVGAPHLPTRAAAPLSVAARHRSTRLCIVHTLRVLHAVACQQGLPARGTVRGRAAHPARCHDRAAIYPRALPGRRDRDIAPYRHYTRPYAPPFPAHPSPAHRLRTHRPRIARASPAHPHTLTPAHRPWRLATAPSPPAPGRRPHHASKIRGNAKTRIAPDFFFFCAQNAAAAN